MGSLFGELQTYRQRGMNILFCEPLSTRTLSTSHVHVYEVVTNLTKLGHNVVPLSRDAASGPAKPDDRRRPSMQARFRGAVRSLPLYERFKGHIHILWLLQGELRTFLRALSLLLRHRRKFDVIYRRHALFASECLLARLFRITAIREVNGIIADEVRIAYDFDRISLRLIHWIESRSIRKADRLIVVTPRINELLQTEYGIPGHQIVVIENGANTDLFRPMDASEARRVLEFDQTGDYICFVGNLWPPQGVQYIIQAMPRIVERCEAARLLIVGDGQMRQELSRLAERFGVTHRVTFAGMVPYGKVPLYLNSCDVCVAPFVRERNEKSGLSPLKMCEYAACAKPVVASRLPGLEFLEDHGLGILVEPEHPHELTDAIITLLKDPELRKKMGQNGRKYVVENRSWASVARKVADVCQQAHEERTAAGKRPTP